MANNCASLEAFDHSWAIQGGGPWAAKPWLSPAAAALEDEALTSALCASMSSASASASPTPSTSTTSSVSEQAYPKAVLVPSPAQARTRPTGRVAKRKPRASRRAPTTYISADPANFRRMVQEITGVPAPCGAVGEPAFTSAARPASLGCILPTLDTSAFLLDRAPTPPPPPPPPEEKGSCGAAAMEEARAQDELLLLELDAMVRAPAMASFPTLESWGMI